jgi:hypothetical protein
MVLTADTRTKKIALSGVPAGATATLVIQDTSRGGNKNLTLKANSDGVATGEFPDFDFAKSVTVKVSDEVYRLTFDAAQPEPGLLRLSDGTAPKPEPATAKESDALAREWLESDRNHTTVVGEELV